MNARAATASLLSMILVVGCETPSGSRTTSSQSVDTAPLLSPDVQPDESGSRVGSAQQWETELSIRPDSPVVELSADEFRFARALAAYGQAILSSNVDPAAPATIDEYEKVVRLDPMSIKKTLSLANVYRQLNRYDDSARVLMTARVTHPDNIDIQTLLSYVYQVANDYTNAVIEYERLATMDPGSASTYVLLAESYFELDDEERAFDALERGMKQARDRQGIANTCQLIAARMASLGNIESAIRGLNIIYRSNPADPTIIGALIGYHLALKQDKKADQMVSKLDSKLLEDSSFLSSLAELYYKTGNFEKGLRYFRKTVELAQGADFAERILTGAFYYEYAACSERFGHIEKAEHLFLKSLELEPKNHRTMNYLAYMWAEQGSHLDNALEFVLRALEFEPQNAAYIDTLGWIYYRLERNEEALEQIERANQLNPSDPTLSDHLGDVYATLADDDNALKHWEASYLLDPENTTVAEKLASRGIDIKALDRKIEDESKDRERE